MEFSLIDKGNTGIDYLSPILQCKTMDCFLEKVKDKKLPFSVLSVTILVDETEYPIVEDGKLTAIFEKLQKHLPKISPPHKQLTEHNDALKIVLNLEEQSLMIRFSYHQQFAQKEGM